MNETNVEPPAFRRIRTESFGQLFKGGLFGQRLPLGVRNAQGENLLHAAIAERKDDVASELVRLGVNLDDQDAQGRTPLHWALAYKNKAIAMAIIQAGANPNLVDQWGNNAVWAAAVGANGDYSIVQALIANGGRVDIKNKVGKSVFDMAEERDDPQLRAICSAAT